MAKKAKKRAKRKRGVPNTSMVKHKVTATVVKAAAIAAADGATDNGIAHAIGVTLHTLRSWMVKGGAEDGPEPYRGLCVAIESGKAEAETRCVRALLNAGCLGLERVEVVQREGRPDIVKTTQIEPDWRAAQAYLERRYPDRWSPKREVHMSGDLHQKHIILDGRDPFGDLASSSPEDDHGRTIDIDPADPPGLPAPGGDEE